MIIEFTFKKTGGFLKHPTPGGVPVRITSPGFNVINLKQRKIHRFLTLNQESRVGIKLFARNCEFRCNLLTAIYTILQKRF
jgi:hypothetical protein